MIAINPTRGAPVRLAIGSRTVSLTPQEAERVANELRAAARRATGAGWPLQFKRSA